VIGLLHRRSPTAGVKRVCRPWAEGTKAVSSEDTKAESNGDRPRVQQQGKSAKWH
jgi:hypothetical protein